MQGGPLRRLSYQAHMTCGWMRPRVRCGRTTQTVAKVRVRRPVWSATRHGAYLQPADELPACPALPPSGDVYEDKAATRLRGSTLSAHIGVWPEMSMLNHRWELRGR